MDTNIDRIKKDIEVINSFNSTPGKGISRFSFSKEHESARKYIAKELDKIGAEVVITTGGNMRGRLKNMSNENKTVMVGSHIDSVLHGGRFDGVVGVVAALECARTIVENKIPHQYPIDVVVFAEEEGSRFGSVMAGSRAWTGIIADKDLEKLTDENDINYLQAMEDAGIGIQDKSILSKDVVKAMFELHIEQSVVLEQEGFQIGIVEAIAGIKQFDVMVEGIANHAGGTPMEYRYDAMQGAAHIISSIEHIVTNEIKEKAVATVGSLICKPGQANIIPAFVTFSVDARCAEENTLNLLKRMIIQEITKVCDDRKLKWKINERSDTPPVKLSRELTDLISTVLCKRNIPFMRMTSGALHDSSVLAKATDVGFIFVPSKNGRSHCPEEYTRIEDIWTGSNILLDSLLAAAK